MLERLAALQEAREALCDEGVREEALRLDKAMDSPARLFASLPFLPLLACDLLYPDSDFAY